MGEEGLDVEQPGDTSKEANVDYTAANMPKESNQSTETTKSDHDNSEHKETNYARNIVLTTSNAGLSLDAEKNKPENLLPDSNTVVRFSPMSKQTLTATSSILLTLGIGLTSGFSAILLPQLKSNPGDIPGDEETASWIASMAALPMAPGCLLSGWIMERFGRRTSHLIICAPFLLGWILIACATNLSLLLTGRFLTGLCLGLLGPLGPVYISETTEPKYRGFFLAGVSLAVAVGIFLAHIVGSFISWHWTAALCCIVPVLSICLLLIVPESPVWLISKARLEDGIKAFHWLRGFDDDAKIELKGILENQKTRDLEPVMTLKDKMQSLKRPEVSKPLLIMIFFFVVSQFTGINAVAFYSIKIVEKAVGTGIDHYLVMWIIDIVRVVMSLVACVVCKKYGRRPMAFISGIWTALSMMGLAMFLYFAKGSIRHQTWIPLSCLTIYICAISIGYVPLTWMMCGEVFPTRVRGFGSGISSATAFLAFFIVVKTAPGMMMHWGEEATFMTYGVVALFGTVILYFILPETKGKSLQEIEDKFKGLKP